MEPSTDQLTQFALLLRRLCNQSFSLEVSTVFDASEADDARLSQYDGAPIDSVAGVINDPRWDGLISGTIRLKDLKIPARSFRLLGRLLDQKAYRTVLSHTLLQARLVDFQEYVTLIGPMTWEQAVRAPAKEFSADVVILREDRTWSLVFFFSAGTVAMALNAELQTAASEGADQKEVLPGRRLVELFARLLERLARGDYPVNVTVVPTDYRQKPTATALRFGVRRWPRWVTAVVECKDLGITDDMIERLLPLLSARAVWVDVLGECLMATHFREFEQCVANLPSAMWSETALARCHQHWGLYLQPSDTGAPPQLMFVAHVNRLAQSLNARLLRAAHEGDGR